MRHLMLLFLLPLFTLPNMLALADEVLPAGMLGAIQMDITDLCIPLADEAPPAGTPGKGGSPLEALRISSDPSAPAPEGEHKLLADKNYERCKYDCWQVYQSCKRSCGGSGDDWFSCANACREMASACGKGCYEL